MIPRIALIVTFLLWLCGGPASGQGGEAVPNKWEKNPTF